MQQLVPMVVRTCDAVDELDHLVLTDSATDSAGGGGGGGGRGTDVKAQQAHQRGVLQRLAGLRQRLAKLRSSFVSKREILTRLCSSELPVVQITPSVRHQLRSVLDQVSRLSPPGEAVACRDSDYSPH
jgi:Mg2+ and Co2+ transporter CorA